MRKPATSLIRVDDEIEIAVDDYGGDGPLVLLHHAVGFCAGVWAETVQQLDGAAHVFALDARGHGRSSKPRDPSAYSWSLVASDLCAIAQSLSARFGQRIALGVGHSFGGACTLGAAAQAPDLFQRLIALDPVVIRRAPESSPDASAPTRRGPSALSRFRRAVFPSFEAALESWQSKPLFQSWHPAVLRAYVDHGLMTREDGQVELRCPPEIEAAVFQGGRGLDLIPLASQISAPAQIYWAEHGSFSLETYRALAALMPRATVSTVPTGHLVPMERPDLTAALIRAALS